MPSSLTAVLLIIAGIEPNPSPAAIKIGLLNACSIVNNGPLIQDMISSDQLDIKAVIETWIASDDPDATKLDAVLDGYAASHLPRPAATQRCRGSLYHPPEYLYHPLHQKLHWQSFECNLLSVKITSGSTAGVDEKFLLAIIYRPPSSTTASLTAILNELSDLLSYIGAGHRHRPIHQLQRRQLSR